MYEQEKPNLLTNKKFLIFVAIIIILGLIFFFIFSTNNVNPDDDTIETDSSKIDLYLESTEDYAYDNHPISHYLPIIKYDPYFCISYDVTGANSEEYTFKLTIEYSTDEGKTAAENLLNTQFAEYNPDKYEIVYTQVNDVE